MKGILTGESSNKDESHIISTWNATGEQPLFTVAHVLVATV